MKIRAIFTAAAIAAGTVLTLGSAGASAATLSPHLNSGVGFDADPALAAQSVQHRRDRHWDRNRDGPRYRSQRPGYRHFHEGYWYRAPWWTFSFGLPGVGLGLGVGDTNSHVEWCQNRYRSYNPSTDRFLGYDGDYHRCNSPYR